MGLQAEILSTGDEVLTGATVDSNAAFIADLLVENGVDIKRHVTVGDNLEILSDVFREAAARADLVLVTGGLGPTGDDLTAEAAAGAADLPLKIDLKALARMEAYFRKRKFPMTETNRKQAMFPKGAEPLENPVGTAPGFSMKIGSAIFFFMPGVPFEMKRMMADQVLPRIRKMQGTKEAFNLTRIISAFGLGESDVAQRLRLFDSHFPDLRLGFQVKYPGILLKIYPGEGDGEKMSRRIAAAADWICGELGPYVISPDGRSLAEVVGDLLKEQGATLSVAESCTGGLISHLLTDVPGSSDYFLFSGVTYANEAKTGILNVPPETIQRHGAVSEETVKAMASGARAVGGATFGLATSGIAGPSGGTADKPVGTVCIGLAGPDGVQVKRRLFTYGRRLMNKQMFATAALDMLRRRLIKASQ